MKYEGVTKESKLSLKTHIMKGLDYLLKKSKKNEDIPVEIEAFLKQNNLLLNQFKLAGEQ